MRSVLDAGRRILGLLLLALGAAPAFLILNPEEYVELQMRNGGALHWAFTWGGAAGWWTLLILAAAMGAGWVTRGRLRRALTLVGELIAAPPRWTVALLVGALGAALTVWVVHAVFDGRTVLNDASVQLIQARYFAAGHLAGPPLVRPEFWSVQFMIQTATGWVSQYPPLHALWLAAGFKLGAAWIAMAAAMGLTGVCLVAAFERLLPNRIGAARLAAVLCVTSPLLLGLAAAYMNHATVAALASVALYLALRADAGAVGWAAAAGAAMGAMVTTRPVSGLVIGLAVTVGVWLTGERHAAGLDRAWLGRRLGAWALGGLPFAIGFGWFNARFFGSPLTLGYVAASGPSHGLGFHENPWGRLYDSTQAVGATSAELVALGRELLGTPFPVVAFIAVFLVLARVLTRGERILVAWALLPVLASALYWHHDLVFGPRMLGGAVPAWSALAVLSAIGLVRMIRIEWAADALIFVLLTALGYAVVFGARDRVTRFTPRLAPRIEVEETGPSLVFVHELWGDRMGGRLSGTGLRLDSVRTLLTRFHPCQLEAALRGAQVADVMSTCRREEAADSLLVGLGAPGLTNFLWLGDLPGLPPEGPLWVRDLGPERNAELIASHPDRRPLFLLPEIQGGGWHLVPYEGGVRLLWGGAPEATGSTPGGSGSASAVPGASPDP